MSDLVLPDASVMLDVVSSMSDEMQALLQKCLQIPSVSGDEADFVRFIDTWARSEGFETDLWETDEAQLSGYAWPMSKHIPLAGRPTLVIRLPGREGGGGRSLLFNAHSDVVGAPEPETWRFAPWSGTEHDGAIYGRGACDVKGPLVSALWAMKTLRQTFPQGLDGDILLELVPGEEDCVGLGTLTSLARGYRADGAVILEPSENVPRCASRGGCRFEVVVRGQAVHGTVKWLGKDAIEGMRTVLAAIQSLEQRWNNVGEDDLFSSYPTARPMMVDAVHGGRWQGMVCDRCACAGYLELLPGDSMEQCKRRFVDELLAETARMGGPRQADIEVLFSEEYGGHLTPPSHDLCQIAQDVLQSQSPSGELFRWMGFNSGCEAGLRFAVEGTPTLVWGPGTLAQAHAADESIRFDDVQLVALLYARMCCEWAMGRKR